MVVLVVVSDSLGEWHQLLHTVLSLERHFSHHRELCACVCVCVCEVCVKWGVWRRGED